MPTRDSAWPPGTPCWIDYGAADVDAAKAFYADVLGWSYEGGEPEYGGYLTAMAQGHEAAGLAPQQDPNEPPRWTTYFASNDVDATVATITARGGSLLLGPTDVGPVGRMALARDPEGNPFGVWQAGEHIGVNIFNEPGALVWNEAAVEDIARAQVFYSDVFGFRFDPVEDMGGYATFSTSSSTGSAPLGGLGGLQPGAVRGWSSCFAVGDTDAVAATVEADGGKVVMAANDTPYGRFAVLEDPWGASFSVVQQLGATE
jgi:predicted enzyme related to lactoylglutathione lyase